MPVDLRMLIEQGRLTVVVGKEASGKTTALLNMATSYKGPVVLVSNDEDLDEKHKTTVFVGDNAKRIRLMKASSVPSAELLGLEALILANTFGAKMIIFDLDWKMKHTHVPYFKGLAANHGQIIVLSIQMAEGESWSPPFPDILVPVSRPKGDLEIGNIQRYVDGN